MKTKDLLLELTTKLNNGMTWNRNCDLIIVLLNSHKPKFCEYCRNDKKQSDFYVNRKKCKSCYKNKKVKKKPEYKMNNLFYQEYVKLGGRGYKNKSDFEIMLKDFFKYTLDIWCFGEIPEFLHKKGCENRHDCAYEFQKDILKKNSTEFGIIFSCVDNISPYS
jgi:hypothetical protein